MILRSVQSVLSLVILMGAGYWLAGKSWFGQRGGDILSKLSVNLCIPAYMCYNVMTTCGSRQALVELVAGLPAPVAAILLGCLGALVLLRVFRVEKGRRGVFLDSVAFCNTVLMGFPIVEALFGESASPVAMIYYMANTVLFWTIGVYALRVDSGSAPKFFSVENLKKIFSPPVLGFLLGALLVLLEVELPYFLMDPLTRLGQCTTPVSMMFIGCLLRATDFRTIWGSRELWAVIGARFLGSPLLMLLICSVFPLTLQMRQVFFVMSIMPAMTQMGIMAKESGSDAHFASASVAATTVISVVVLPLYTIVMEALPLLSP